MSEFDKRCLYSFKTKLPSCILLRVYRYSYLKDFISNTRTSFQDLSIATKIECIEFKGGPIDIRNENCINCMFCVFGCPGNNIEVKKDFSLKAMCSNFSTNYDDKLLLDKLDLFFTGEFIKLPEIRLRQLSVKYKSFEDFTSKEETTNIAVWGANTLKYLSNSIESRIAIEVGLKITTRDRGGRLDICLINNNILLVAEAKVSFEKMMNEGRYVSQLIAYEEELELATTSSDIQYCKFLLIGGPESDLLPTSHPMCTSKVGGRGQLFYNALEEHNFFFISANALLSLSLLKLNKGDNYSIENIYKKLFSKGNLGLLSSGIVCRKGDNIVIVPISNIL